MNMKHFYLMMVHTQPNQLKELIKVLNCENTYFIIHVDLKTNINQFKNEISGSNILFVENRVDCIWADFSQVQACLNMINTVKNCYEFSPFDRITLLSGQDYPIKGSNYIKNFLNNHKTTTFIDLEELEGIHKKNFYSLKINYGSKRGEFTIFALHHYKLFIKNLLQNKISLKQLSFIFKKKKLSQNLIEKKGSQWWSMPLYTINAILDYYNQHKTELNDFFQHTFCPDELFFHTIYNEISKNLKDNETKSSLTYVNWKRLNTSLPVTFLSEDLNELLSQSEGKLFARKFDLLKDPLIFKNIDKNILND